MMDYQCWNVAMGGAMLVYKLGCTGGIEGDGVHGGTEVAQEIHVVFPLQVLLASAWDPYAWRLSKGF